MKRTIAFVMSLLLALSLAACSAPGYGQNSNVPPAGSQSQIANPWTQATSSDEAAEGAGVEFFSVPSEEAQTSVGPINWYGFQFMEGLAEADGAIGTAELVIRKGIRQDGGDVSGDYTEYKHSWTQDANGQQILCYGNEEGKTMKAIWDIDDYSYSIMVRGQGDEFDTFGLEEADTAAIVYAIL